MTATQPTSQRLQEVCRKKGITIKSEKVWTRYYDKLSAHEPEVKEREAVQRILSYRDIIPALSFDEAWALLPEKIQIAEYNYPKLKMSKMFSCGKTCTIIGYVDSKPIQSIYAKNYGDHHIPPAEAATLLLIWCIEQGYYEQA